MQVAQPAPFADARHPQQKLGPMVALYVWQYPIRLFHWGLVLSIGVLSFTGYYIHNPFIVGQVNHPFLMGWFRFVHEAFGMLFIALFLLRIYLFFGGNHWVRWRQYVPLHASQWQEMWEVMKFYGFIRPTPMLGITSAFMWVSQSRASASRRRSWRTNSLGRADN